MKFTKNLFYTAFFFLSSPFIAKAINYGGIQICPTGDRCCDTSTGKWMDSSKASSCADDPQTNDPAGANNQSLNVTFNLGRAPFDRPANYSGMFQSTSTSDEKNKFPMSVDGMSSFYNANPMSALWKAEVYLRQPSIDADAFKLSSLDYNHSQRMEVLKVGDEIRQVKTHDFFIAFDPLPSTASAPQEGYTVRMWFASEVAPKPSSAALYTEPIGIPTKEATVSNPTPFENYNLFDLNMEQAMPEGTSRKLHLRYESFSAGLGESSFPELVLQTWTGAPGTAGAAQVFENRLAYVSGAPVNGVEPDNQTRIRTYKRADRNNTSSQYGSLHVIGRVREEFITIDGKRRRVKDILLNDFTTQEAGLATTYGYYDTPSNPLTHARPHWQKNADGSWVIFQVSGSTSSQTIKTITPFKNTPGFILADDGSNVGAVPLNQCKVVTQLITGTSMESYTDVLGQRVSRRKTSFQVGGDGHRIMTTNRFLGSEGDAPFLSSQVAYFQDGSAVESGRIAWSVNEDGTAEVYSYSAIATGGVKVVSASGAPNGSDYSAVSSIVAGTETTTYFNEFWIAESSTSKDIETDLDTGSWMALSQDLYGRLTKVAYNGNVDDYTITKYGCCGPIETRDRSGAVTKIYNDILKRPYKTTFRRSSTGPLVTTTYNNVGLTKTTERTQGATTLFVSETTRSLDNLTQTIKSADADNDSNTDHIVTTARTFPAGGGSQITTTYPDTTFTVRTTYRDGRMVSSTDQGGHSITYDYGSHDEYGGGLWSRVTQANTTEWTETYSDMLGRTRKVEYPNAAEALYTYFESDAAIGSRNKMKSFTDPDENADAGNGSAITYEYNAEGELTTVTSILPDAQTLIQVSDQDVLDDPILGISFRSRSWVNGILTGTDLRSVNGYLSRSTSLAGTSSSTKTVAVDGAWTVSSLTVDRQQSVQTYTDGQLERTEFFDNQSPPTSISSTTYTYDGFGRALTTVDARTGVTTINGYLENGAVTSVTTNGGADTSAYTYDTMGRITTTTLPDTSQTHTSYTARGQVLATWGSQTYAKLYQYDALGRMNELRTYQDLAYGTEPTSTTADYASTTWTYDLQRGWLTEKNYAGESANGPGNAADYTYTLAGRLATRTWERGVTTTYAYNQGKLETITYSNDPAKTPNVSYTYDSFGRATLVAQSQNGTGTSTLTSVTYAYDPANFTLTSETTAYDTDADGTADFSRVLSRYYDEFLRPLSAEVPGQYTAAYGYDAAGRLEKVWDQPILSATSQAPLGAAAFDYAYRTNSWNLIEAVTAPSHTVTNTWEDHRNILLGKNNHTGDLTAPVSNYQYGVTGALTQGANNLGQRKNLTTTGLAFDGIALADSSATGPAYSWNYNGRGELTEANDASTAADHRAYQYDGIGNRQKAIDGLFIDLTSAATNYEANDLNQYTRANGVTLPVSAYDADGNMTSGPLPVATGNATLVWDAENRLVQITRADSTIIHYHYDAQSRRTTKKVGTATTTHYLYDGWNLIAEYTGTVLEKTYTWGMDVSGSMQGAGGVGGLLSVDDQVDRYYPTYDGNGNVSEYLNATGVVAAHYEYDAFGNTTVSSGAKKDDFLHRFSTKPLDAETGLYYYGYRYYDPVTGRWPSRDPIGENWSTGEFNGYAMVLNNAVSNFDYLGLFSMSGMVNYIVDILDNPTCGGVIDRTDNCLSHAFNRTYGTYAPKGFEGVTSCPEFIDLIKEDPKLDMVDVPENGCCPKGYHKIKISLAIGEDFHLWRQDSDGGWSHVPGDGAGGSPQKVGKNGGGLVTDPSEIPTDLSDSGSFNYNEDCGLFCAKTDSPMNDLERKLKIAMNNAFHGETNEEREAADKEVERINEQIDDIR